MPVFTATEVLLPCCAFAAPEWLGFFAIQTAFACPKRFCELILLLNSFVYFCFSRVIDLKKRLVMTNVTKVSHNGASMQFVRSKHSLENNLIETWKERKSILQLKLSLHSHSHAFSMNSQELLHKKNLVRLPDGRMRLHTQTHWVWYKAGIWLDRHLSIVVLARSLKCSADMSICALPSAVFVSVLVAPFCSWIWLWETERAM